jgi:hypothetical protein
VIVNGEVLATTTVAEKADIVRRSPVASKTATDLRIETSVLGLPCAATYGVGGGCDDSAGAARDAMPIAPRWGIEMKK